MSKPFKETFGRVAIRRKRTCCMKAMHPYKHWPTCMVYEGANIGTCSPCARRSCMTTRVAAQRAPGKRPLPAPAARQTRSLASARARAPTGPSCNKRATAPGRGRQTATQGEKACDNAGVGSAGCGNRSVRPVNNQRTPHRHRLSATAEVRCRTRLQEEGRPAFEKQVVAWPHRLWPAMLCNNYHSDGTGFQQKAPSGPTA